jgi:CRISPR/Cas system CSM-associated protein Csm3 (group 7 of RAMP superfamily)
LKLEAKLEFKTTTALIIAGGEIASGLGIDKATIRDKKGELIIPASTIKGKLRDECQRILVGLNPKIFVCMPPRAETMCPQPFISKEKNSVPCCPICEIFGSPWEPCQLYFSDLIVTSNDLKGLHSIKIGVAIDRHSRTAKEKSLYYLQTSPQGIECAFVNSANVSSGLTIHGELKDTKQAALLYVGIQSLLNIGGSKSVGLGWLNEDKIAKFSLDGESFQPSEAELKEWKDG